MKWIYSVLCLLTIQFNFAQGIEIVPDNLYEDLNTPFILSGSGELPKKAVIPSSLLPSARDQGSQQSCVGWSIGYYYMTYYQNLKSGLSTSSYDYNSIYSPSYLYQSVKSCNDCRCGSRIDEALNFLMNKGIVTYSAYPFDTAKCSKLDPNTNIKSTYTKIPNWYRIEDLKNLSEYKRNLAQGIPVVLTLKVNKAFYGFKYKKENDVFKLSTIDDYEYHAILCTGYDDKLQAMQVYNSWGEKWGNKGFAWIDYSTFLKMIKQAFFIEKPQIDKQTAATLASYSNGRNNRTNQNDRVTGGSGSSSGTTSTKPIEETPPRGSNSKPTSKPKTTPSQGKPKTSTPPAVNKPIVLKPDIKNGVPKGPSDGVTRDGVSRDAGAPSEEKFIKPYIVSEPIGHGRKYYTMGVNIAPMIRENVKKVVYQYYISDNYYEEEEVTDPPFYRSSYEGKYCIQNIHVDVYLKDGTVYPYLLNGCEFDNIAKDNISLDQLEIEPDITLLDDQDDEYKGADRDDNDEEQMEEDDDRLVNFKIDMRGIDIVKNLVQKIEFSCKDPLLGPVFATRTPANHTLEGVLSLSDCNEKLDVTVYFNNGIKKSFKIDMCEELGWE